MKILAIRGKNLASLAGTFEIDLEREPLHGAGLFAITGPTGSGKTTLLDAMALALFDRIPRYRHVNRYTQGEGSARMSSQDPRHILRLGAVEGYAQVDFQGKGGICYRASWRVRRAHNRADGRLMDQTVELENLDSKESLSQSRKTDTLDTIRERLGLDFEQFCRSVLLAQGEFAAFLKAKPLERGELLERMTGTEIYSRLSQLAHERHKQEQEQLAEIHRRKEQLQVLSEAERETLQTTLTEARERHQQHWEAYRQLETQHQKQQERHRLEEQVREKQELLEKLSGELAEIRGGELEALIAVQPVRDLLKAFDQGEAVAKQMTAEIQTTLRQQNEATTANTEANKQLREREQALKQHRYDMEASKPECEQARDLDNRILEKQREGQRIQEQLDQLTAQLEQARKECEQHQNHEQQLHEKQDALNRSMSQNPHLEQLLENEKYWFGEMARGPQCLAEGKTQRREMDRLAQAIAASEKVADREAAALAQAETALQEAETRWQAGTKEVEQLSATRPENALENLREAERNWQELTREVIAIETLDGELKTVAAERQRLSSELDQLREKQEQLQTNAKAWQLELGGLERGLKLAQDATELSSRRAELLQADKPCPLCGSLEHPLAGADQLAQELANLAEDVAALKRRIEENRSEETKIQSHRAVTETNMTRLREEDEKKAAEQRERTERQMALLQELNLDEAPGVPEAQVKLTELDERLRAMRKQAALLVAAREQVAAADKTRSKIRPERDRLKDARGEALRQLESMRSEQDTASQKRETALAEWRALEERLQPLFHEEGAREQWRKQPEAFIERMHQALAGRRKEREQIREFDEQLQKLKLTLTAASERIKEREQQQKPLQNQARDSLAAEEQLRQTRAQLLGGKPIAEVEEHWRVTSERLEQVRDEARHQGENARRRLETIGERLQQQYRQEAAHQEELEEHRERLDEKLLRLDCSLKTLRERLERSPEWIAEQQRKMQELEQRITVEQALLQASKARLAEFLDASGKLRENETLEEELKQAKSAFDAVVDEKNRLEIRMEEDGQRRQQAGELVTELERQQAKTELWEQMSQLIGSHDGRKFRKFAQSLTLDVLVGAANGHMQELQPRYWLQRVQGQDMELHVLDRDMGDEERTMASLSGGETFQVSLALALGLASLTADDTQIGSLFIDEGFGALDARSLDTALDTLEQLQANGRQVGIISHVGSVAEKVPARIHLVRGSNGSSRVTLIGH